MSQIKPLAMNQRVLTWTCICPIDVNTNKRKKLLFIIFTCAIYLSIICGLASSYAFLVAHLSTDLEEAFYALLQITVFAGLIYVQLIAFILRHKITAFLGTLSEIYESSK